MAEPKRNPNYALPLKPTKEWTTAEIEAWTNFISYPRHTMTERRLDPFKGEEGHLFEKRYEELMAQLKTATGYRRKALLELNRQYTNARLGDIWGYGPDKGNEGGDPYTRTAHDVRDVQSGIMPDFGAGAGNTYMPPTSLHEAQQADQDEQDLINVLMSRQRSGM